MFLREVYLAKVKIDETLSYLKDSGAPEDVYFDLVSAKEVLLSKIMSYVKGGSWLARNEARQLIDSYFRAKCELGATYTLLGVLDAKKQSSIRSSLSQRSRQLRYLFGASLINDVLNASDVSEVSRLEGVFSTAISPSDPNNLFIYEVATRLPASASSDDISVDSLDFSTMVNELRFLRQYSHWFVSDRLGRFDPSTLSFIVMLLTTEDEKYRRHKDILRLLFTGCISVEDAISSLSSLES